MSNQQNPIKYKTSTDSKSMIEVTDILELVPCRKTGIDFSTPGAVDDPTNYVYRPITDTAITIKNCKGMTNTNVVILYIDKFVQFDKAKNICAVLDINSPDTKKGIGIFLENGGYFWYPDPTSPEDEESNPQPQLYEEGKYIKLCFGALDNTGKVIPTSWSDSFAYNALHSLQHDNQIIFSSDPVYGFSIGVGSSVIRRVSNLTSKNKWIVTPQIDGDSII